MKASKWLFPGMASLLLVVTTSGVHAGHTSSTNPARITSATIGDTTITNTTSPWIIEDQTFTWNGVSVTVTRYPSTGTARARIEIVSDATTDTIGIYNAAFTATGPVTNFPMTNFPINFQSTGLGPAPTTPPTWYYVQGSGNFVDAAPLNSSLQTIGRINPDPVNTPNGWNQLGNTLLHNTAGCSCLTFGPTLGYKTYAQSTFSHQRGLRAETQLTLGAANEAINITYVKVNNGPAPGTDDSVNQACEIAKEEECESVIGKQGFFCGVFGITCPRCSDTPANLQKIKIIENPADPITK